ncbi:hypothetical protein LY10_00573 [Planktotalea frisia]|uniref:DUF4177 domain-containing protein n=1 Tax=Planktotalea frisia TaxID=696762 RepID=A0A1L9NTV2_9RHOB|nr:hypothetical protein PFRI_31990 [Planktotalea frisia]PZX33325.1 hypothetical protein LY10_00573 [Planktotalea frisia]
MRYEYKVIPAPARGQKGKGVKGVEGRFANALETLMNQMGSDGWEYQRAETLPSEERAGLTSKTTVFRNVLVFRRVIETDVESFEPKLLDAPEPEPEPEHDDEETAESLDEAEISEDDTPEDEERRD